MIAKIALGSDLGNYFQRTAAYFLRIGRSADVFFIILLGMIPKGTLIPLLLDIAPFVVLSVLYALLAYPLYRKNKRMWHAIVSVLLLVLFGLWIFTLGRHAPAGPGPGGFGPGGAGFGNPGAPPEFTQAPPPTPGPSLSQGIQTPPPTPGPSLSQGTQTPPPTPGPSLSQGTPAPPRNSAPDGPFGDFPGSPGLFGKYRPEFTKLFIALMMLMVERGFLDWLRAKFRKRKGDELPIDSDSAIPAEGLADIVSPATETAGPATEAGSPSDDLVIKFARKTVTIPLASIIYIESMSEYVKFHLDDPAEPVILLGSLKKLMEMLPADRFIRIHRSYIVATGHIRKTETASVTLDGGQRLPVGESFRPALKAWSARK